MRLVGLCAVGAALEAETYLDHRWLVASLAGSANFQVFVGHLGAVSRRKRVWTPRTAGEVAARSEKEDEEDGESCALE